ncbi:MerR family transcriptional regulator [Novipirellula caenicola]|uniref:BRCT domain-containing protein n=1 Tax=Novipirellula caenicola TaxID=1536901 RepID=A0ABP9VHB4_9BACT
MPRLNEPIDSNDLAETELAETAGLSDGAAENETESGALRNLKIALVGRFGSMTRREAANLLRSYGATIVEQRSADVDWVVIGADQSPVLESDLLTESTRHAIATGTREIVYESELWQRLGLVDFKQSAQRYYTPAMLAHLLGISVRVVRRWQRLGLITPVETMHRLPYFDFAEVAVAKRLANWIASGESPKAIEQRLAQWVELLPDIHRPLEQLSILVEGELVLLRHGEGLVEPGGQLRFDFDALDEEQTESTDDDFAAGHVLSMVREDDTSFPVGNRALDDSDELLMAAYQAEDEDDLQRAIDFYHAILARDGPRADINFQMGELLYRIGETIASRERYYSAIEIDPEFVEARASLGIVLAETGQPELGVASFQGALQIFEDYSDVHYHLAKTLDSLGRTDEANHHWARFLELFPDSPWADEARLRLAETK